MAKLIKAVHVRDPERHRTVLLLPGEEPEPRLAALVTNPAAWEDGKLPDQDPAETAESSQTSDDDSEAAPAAKKTAATRKSAASKPARGRSAADEGTSGD